MIHTYYKSVHDQQLNQIEQPKPGSWIHVNHTTKEDLEEVAALLQIDLADIQDSLDSHEIPRLERENGTTILFVRNPLPDESPLHTELLVILISKEYLVTITPYTNQVVEKILRKNNPSIATTQKMKLLLHILLQIAHSYTHHVRAVRSAILKKEVTLDQVTSKDIFSLTKSEEILNQYLSSLSPMRTSLEVIMSGKHVDLYEEDEDLLEDVLIALNQSADICTINLKSIRGVRDSYQIIFTNNLNRTMKLLTSITIILTIPTIVSSIFGMNVILPYTSNPLSFPVILLFSILLSSTTLLIFLKKQWL